MHCCKIKFITGILFLLVFSVGQARPADSYTVAEQNSLTDDSLEKKTPDFQTVDSVSYQLYLDGKWKELTVYGEKALKEGYDYYYLRMRLGIAYFELKQFRKAIQHFEKARAFSPTDEYAMRNLYTCYLYTERYEEAKWLSRSFSPAVADSLLSRNLSSIDFINVESGTKVCDSSRLFKNPFFTNAGIGHSLARRVFLFHNLSYYKQVESRFNVDQTQYYLRLTIPVKHGFQLLGGFHFVHINSDIRSVEQTSSSYTYEIPGGPGNPPPPPRTVSVTTLTNTDKMTNRKSNNYIGALAVSKHFTYFDVSLGLTSASFDSTFQNQVNVGIGFYPLKNNSFSIGTNTYFHREDLTNARVAFAPYASIYITPKINICASYFHNEGPNVTEANGYFVSNSIDYTLQRMALIASLKMNTAVWLYGTYGYEIKKHVTSGYQYNYHIFALGLRVIPKFK